MRPDPLLKLKPHEIEPTFVQTLIDLKISLSCTGSTRLKMDSAAKQVQAHFPKGDYSFLKSVSSTVRPDGTTTNS